MRPDTRNAVQVLCTALVMTAAMAGCVSALDTAARPPAAAERDPATALLTYARRLREATPGQRADAVDTAHHNVDESPSAGNFARLALAYGTPNQRRYTPDEAARYAQRALDADEAHWSPAAQQYLHDYARLYNAIAKPQAAAATVVSSRAAQATDPAARSAAADRARIARLQAQLDEAHRKLRELANIEDRLGEAEP